MPDTICELCKRTISETTRHHLNPHAKTKGKKGHKKYSKEERSMTAALCIPCHDKIHATFTEQELAKEYNTLESLLNHHSIIKFQKWVQKQPDKHIRTRWSNQHG